MGVASGTVILLDYLLPIPDEISECYTFLSIGIAVSTVLNYYQKTNERKKSYGEIFSQWVLDGKDEGMEKNHSRCCKCNAG